MLHGNKLLIVSFLILIYGMFGGQTLLAQDTIHLWKGKQLDSVYDMNYFSAYFVDQENKISLEELVNQKFTPDTALRASFKSRYGHSKFTAWCKWVFHNPNDYKERVQLIFNRNSFLSIYYRNGDGLTIIKNNDVFFSTETKIERSSFFIEVSPASTVEVFGKIPNAYYNYGTGYPVVIRPDEYKSVVQKLVFDHRYYLFADVLFLSIVFFIIIHTLAQYYFNNKRKEFLLYAFYAFCVFNYFLFKLEEYQYIDILYSQFPLIHKLGNNPFSYLLFFAYFRFVRYFIDFKEIAPWFHKLILVTEKLLMGAILVDLMFCATNLLEYKSPLFAVVRVYLVLVAITGISLLFRSRKAISLFIAVGSSFLIMGSMIAMLLSWILTGPYIARFDPMIYMQTGMALELICFTLGLSYKTSLIEKEKISTQDQLISQLEENRKLQEELTIKLESRVKEQTNKLLQQQKEIEKDKEQQLTLEFQKKLTEMELQLLKSQLNPHFYFNTLNNLYGLSMISPVKAPDAILKLSDIMEYVIYDCKSEKVPLTKELKFISSYIDLEKLRYDTEDNIQLKIEMDSDSFEISPLLLIQFIENAFKHGMEDANVGSFLHIIIHVSDGWLHYRSDNSISRKEYSKGGVGLENVRKRLDMLYAGRHTLNVEQSDTIYKVALSLKL